jgi:1-deoxy-D-xylulose-5-phosphate reductoisomerase
LRAGGGAPTILNAANEIAVAAFLGRKIGFLDIAAVVEATLDRLGVCPADTLDAVVTLDALSRREAEKHVAAREAARAA